MRNNTSSTLHRRSPRLATKLGSSARQGLDADDGNRAWLWMRCVSSTSTSISPAWARRSWIPGVWALRRCSRSTAHFSASGVVHVGVGDDVGDGESAVRSEYAGCFQEYRSLVGGQV